ncbi:4535_t:CDS:2 [Entrophospora sp. SA101]|nr:4535_t:CDS:2 [Entrophospora sp. SA101]CAJ0829854.1 9447_t:CDS:2 [Entrophospora sp. SA101]
MLGELIASHVYYQQSCSLCAFNFIVDIFYLQNVEDPWVVNATKNFETLINEVHKEYASNGTNKDEGSRFDWIFSVHDLGKETYWGHELGLFENTGTKIGNKTKLSSNFIAREEKLNDSSKEPWVAENRSPK